MKLKILFFALLLFLTGCVVAQVDTVIKTSAYTSYYSYKLKEPIMVSYKLYKGGGDCSRAKYTFKSTEFTGNVKDYLHSGYDEGHLANAEDFAYDCTLDELTFRYYNCYPQTPLLNRGIWKTLETNIRKQSQTDSLLIVCGGFYNSQSKFIGRIAVPDTCWKAVFNLRTNTFSDAYIFTNTTSPVETTMNIQQFNDILNMRYRIKLIK